MPANRSRLVALFAGAGFALLPLDAAFSADPTGVWMNDTGRGAIEIKPCGGALCGHVVWVKDPTDTKGCGRQIIGNAAKVGANVWDNGWIYSPEKKKKYDVELKPLGSGKLQVTGYAGSKFFSKTMIWTRAPANLGRCGQSETIAKADPKPKSKPDATAKAAGSKPVVTARTEAEPKTKAAAKSEPKIVPPAPKPAERPAAKPDAPAPTTVARAEPEGTAVLATPAPAPQAQPAPPANAPAAPAAPAAPPSAATGAATTGPAADADAPPASPADTSAQPPGEAASQAQEEAPPQTGHPVPDPVEPNVDAEVEQAPHEKGLDMGMIAKRLAELERETGYGLKKSGNGNCRLKVPFATVNFPCKE